jgi:predicted TIM-barrel fold metal-dependent hydrolase
MHAERETSRRTFLSRVAQAGVGFGLGTAALPASAAAARAADRLVIDGMMHLEVWAGNRIVATHWEGIVEEILEHYAAAGIDKGVILTCWTPSRESNDRTLAAYEKYPDRFIPFGHIRPEDPDWEAELRRVSQPPWKGLKLHQAELSLGAEGLKETTRAVIRKAADWGNRVVKIHLVDYALVDELTRELADVIWILPHMGCYGRWEEMRRYCELARNRKDVFLDTSAVAAYWDFGKALEWAGADKLTFASDGFMFSPIVEKAKIESLRLPGPYRTPRITEEQLDMILGGNMAKILGIEQQGG